MSFLNDTKNFGLIIAILGLFDIVSAVLGFASSNIIAAVGALIAGILILLAGLGIYKKKLPDFMLKLFPEGVDSKFGVLTGMMFTVSLATAISAVCALNWLVLVEAIILLILALVITNDKKNVFDKIIWILLVLVAVILAISGFVAIFSVGGDNALLLAMDIIKAVATALMYLMMLLYLLDGSVKK